MIVLNDLLWDGVYKIYQDDKLFKFSLDSILVSKFVTINKSCKNILDIGTGNAPIPMLLRRRCNSHIVGIEKQTEPYNLGLKSIEYNQLNDIELINLDVKEWYKSCLPNTFDTIVTNPPYFKENSMKSLSKNKCEARSEVSLKNEDIIKELKQIGFYYILVGLEAVNNNDLKKYNKLINKDDNVKCVEILNRNNINCMGMFILDLSYNKIRTYYNIKIHAILLGIQKEEERINKYKNLPKIKNMIKY